MKVAWTPATKFNMDGLEALIAKRCEQGLYLTYTSAEPPKDDTTVIASDSWFNVDLESIVGVLSNPEFSEEKVIFELKPTSGSPFSLQDNDPDRLLFNGVPAKNRH